MIYKQIVDNQLYVWMNGSLLYKRWLTRCTGMIFCPIFKAFKSDEANTFKK